MHRKSTRDSACAPGSISQSEKRKSNYASCSVLSNNLQNDLSKTQKDSVLNTSAITAVTIVFYEATKRRYHKSSPGYAVVEKGKENKGKFW